MLRSLLVLQRSFKDKFGLSKTECSLQSSDHNEDENATKLPFTKWPEVNSKEASL